MSAATEDRKTRWNRGQVIALPVAASTKIYNGTMVCTNGSGYAVPAANTSGFIFRGVALEQADNSSGSAGDIKVQVRTQGIFEFTAAGLAQGNEGADMYVSDDQTVTTVAGYVRVGKLAYFDTATNAPILIDPASLLSPGENYFVLPFHSYTIGSTPLVLTDGLEMPRAFTVLRGYADVQTAPGAGEDITITITDGTTPKTVTIAATTTHGEDEAINQAYAADTDIDITVVDDGTTGADLHGYFVCQFA